MTAKNDIDQQTATPYINEWGQLTKRLVRIGLMILLIVTVFIYRPLFADIFFTIILTGILLGPVIAVHQRTGKAYGASVGIVFLIYLVILIALLLFVAFSVTDFVAGAVIQLGMFLEKVAHFIVENTTATDPSSAIGWFIQDLAEKIAATQDADSTPVVIINDLAVVVMGGVASTLNSVGDFIVTLLFIHILTLYGLLELPQGANWIARNLKPEWRREYVILGNNIERVFVNFIRGVGLNIIISTATATVMLLIFGVQYAFVIALLASIFLIIPIVGGYIGGFVVLVGTATSGSALLNLDSPVVEGILVWLVYTLVQGFFINNFVEPRIYSGALSLPIVLIVPTLAVAAGSLGLIGMILVVPVLGIIREVLIYVSNKLKGGDPYPDEPEPVFKTEVFLVSIGESQTER